METKISRVIISGGGTGGHIFPALSIAGALRRRFPDIEILFVGAEGRMEMERVPQAGYRIVGLPVAGFDRKRLWRNAAVLVKLARSLTKARKIVKDFKPQLVIGVGGYASGPVLKAAQRAGIPTLLQEQNSYAGVTNKLLAQRAMALCVAYEGMDRFFPADKIHLTGNPVRKALADCTLSPEQAREALGFDPHKPLLLVVGGSLGARTINQAVGAALDTLTRGGEVSVLWQTGRFGYDAAVEAASGHPTVRVERFITEMDVAYRAASLVVSRAGASTISELQMLGKATILVPSPNVAEDHQRHNAEALVERQAAVMVTDADAPLKLGDTAAALLADTEQLARLGANCAAMALMGSDDKIVDCAVAIVNNSNKVSK